MAAEYNRVGELLVIAPTGEIDHHETKELRREMDAKIIEILPEKIVFDLSRTTFMDSSGLGLILGRFNKASELGIDMELVNPGDKIMKILSMSGVDKIVKVKGIER